MTYREKVEKAYFDLGTVKASVSLMLYDEFITRDESSRLEATIIMIDRAMQFLGQFNNDLPPDRAGMEMC